jgi:hypothetical protein
VHKLIHLQPNSKSLTEEAEEVAVALSSVRVEKSPEKTMSRLTTIPARHVSTPILEKVGGHCRTGVTKGHV